jgi:hypothetical protein
VTSEDGSEPMPLTDMAEWLKYCEWRDSECVTTVGARTASELVDAIESTFPNLRFVAKTSDDV